MVLLERKSNHLIKYWENVKAIDTIITMPEEKLSTNIGVRAGGVGRGFNPPSRGNYVIFRAKRS